MKSALIWLLLLLACTPAFARRRASHHKVAMLFPTAGSLQAQNAEVDRLGLARVMNRAMLAELESDGSLVRIPTGRTLALSCKPQMAYLRPFAAASLAELGQEFYSTFKAPLYVTSAVRPMDYQRRLRRWNKNAAPVGVSVHETGIAFDISRRHLTRAQERWLEWRLWYQMQTQRLIVEQEFRQPCFHVCVRNVNVL